MTTNYQRSQGWTDRPRQDAPSITISVSDVQLKSIPKTLFSNIAEDKARTIAEAGAGKKNKSTQLRRFYDELVMWFERVHFERTPAERQQKYEEVAPFIQMLVAKVAYAKGRDHVDECFETLFAHLIRQISDADSLRNAKLFMEAFMGFYKAQEK